MTFKKKFLSHLIPILGFFIIVSIFFGPLYTGKTLVQSDNIQLTGVNREVTIYKEKGEQIHWNPREFSGVPLLMSSVYNPFGFLNKLLFYGWFPKPVMIAFFLFIGFYILLQTFGVSRWLSAIGALGYAFSSFNIISVEVGHDNKVIAIALMSPVLAGIIKTYRGDLLKGGVLTMLASGFQLYYGHIQITYYLLLMVLAYMGVAGYEYYRSKNWPLFFRASGVLVFATLIAVGCNFSKLYATLEYSGYSTRGGSDLTSSEGTKVSSDGLGKDYALSWSNGKMETFSLIFPYFHGGASREQLSDDSKTFETLESHGVDPRTSENVLSNIPLYWGDQPFTGGPIYFGAVICFLFVLSLFILEGPIKWWGLTLVLLSLLLAMGKNLEWFTDIFFYNVPLYNKFRSVTMILSIAQLLVPFMGTLALHRVLTGSDSIKEVDQKILHTGAIMVGIGLFFLVFKNAFFDFTGSNDQAYGFPDWLLSAIQADRKNLFNSSIIRSLIFIILSCTVLWLYLKKAIRLNYLIVILGILVLVDLWAVDKRYLSSEDFQTKRKVSQQVFQPNTANQQINRDKDYFRVINMAAQNPFSDGITSYHHYSVLGYSAIKMQRYQELIDQYISNMNLSVLGMLNTKYIITKSADGEPVAQRNQRALGNAWLVKEAVLVANADEEYEKLGSIDPSRVALLDKSRFDDLEDNRTYSGNGEIELIDYHPEKLTYKYSSLEDQFAVFSEIYYAPGWNAYVDGIKVNHLRVNYILRGMELPEGEHVIVFKYEPFSLIGGTWIIILSSILLAISIGFSVVIDIRK